MLRRRNEVLAVLPGVSDGSSHRIPAQWRGSGAGQYVEGRVLVGGELGRCRIRRKHYGPPIVQARKVAFSGGCQDGEAQKGCSVRRQPTVPDACEEQHRITVGMDLPRLFRLADADPLVVAAGRHQAVTPREGVPERRLRCCAFEPSIERSCAELQVFGPVRHKPLSHAPGLCATSAVVGDDPCLRRRRDVVSRQQRLFRNRQDQRLAEGSNRRPRRRLSETPAHESRPPRHDTANTARRSTDGRQRRFPTPATHPVGCQVRIVALSLSSPTRRMQ